MTRHRWTSKPRAPGLVQAKHSRCQKCGAREGSNPAKEPCIGRMRAIPAPTFECELCNEKHTGWDKHLKTGRHRALLLRKKTEEEGVYIRSQGQHDRWEPIGEPHFRYFPTAVGPTGLQRSELWVRRDILELLAELRDAYEQQITRLSREWLARTQRIVTAYTSSKWPPFLHQELREIKAYALERRLEREKGGAP